MVAPKQRKKTITIPAPLWKRVLAFLIDLFILTSIILVPFDSAYEEIFSGDSLSEVYEQLLNGLPIGELIFLISAMSLITYVYFVILERKFDQSIGKMVMGLYIITKGKMTLRQILIRNLNMLVFHPFALLTFIDALVSLFDKEGRRYCEKASGTCTVEKVKV